MRQHHHALHPTPARAPGARYLIAAILPLAAFVVLGAICAARGTAASGGTPAGQGTPTYAASQVGAEVCFPFAQWSAPSVDRDPCYTVPAPAEDGSGVIYIGTVANDQAECRVPNVAEESGRFVIRCHRLPGRAHR